MLVVTIMIIEKVCSGGHSNPWMKFRGPHTEFAFGNLYLSRKFRNDVLLMAFYRERGIV